MTTNYNRSRSLGVVVVHRGARGARLLISRVDGTWGFPGAQIKGDETEFDAARRDLVETTGLGDADFPFGDACKDTVVQAGGRVERYFLAETETARITPAPSVGHAPPDASRWISFEEAEDFLPPRLAIVLEWARGMISGD